MNTVWCRKKDCRFFADGPNKSYEYGNCKLAEVVITLETRCENYEPVMEVINERTGEYVSV